MLRVGLIGYGYWGPNLARNFNSNRDCQLVRIADMTEKRRDLARRTFPNVDVVDDAARVTTADDIDVVVVATPVFTHFDLAKTALGCGKHVWVEKPMTSTHAQAKELIALAESKGLTLMVDHTFLFTGAVMKMKELVDAGELGDLYYFDSVRINLGLFQHDINVIWDLAPHDFSIMDYLLGPSARAVTANGSGHFSTGLEDVAYVTVFYDNNLIAHFHLNWLSPVKLRRTVIGGSRRMLVWDDLNPEERIKIYDKGMEVETKEGLYRILATPRIGAMHSPVVPNTEALSLEVEYMVKSIANKEKPFNDGAAGARIIAMLEATDESLRNQGKLVELKS
ncbi:MAG: Gfo/Idh/MocA family oxidoreductase [Candidatus Hydrogenedentes bacterium]|nr:Gfo/Idh/MocA family oxidoreductase [Candidatus Hydrogenedentota bacterium]